jgi:HlyD family secretion protein
MVKFYVELEGRSHPKLRNNLRVDVYVVSGRREHALHVRRGSLGESGSEDVFVVRGNRLVATPVRFGLAAQDDLEVTSGLREGDEVVISNMSDYTGVKTIRLEEK